MSITELRRPGFEVITPDELEERFPALPLYPGITAYPVAWGRPLEGSEEPTVREAYVTFAPEAEYPEVDHHADSSENVLVVYGVFADEGGVYTAGTRIKGEKGSSHTPSSPTGCLLYVTFPDR